jgi:chemotaxis signal transduction protein
VVLELERVPIGVIAAKILGVSDVPVSDIEPLEPSTREEERAQLYRGRLESANEMMLVLDGPGLLEALLDR